MLKKSVVFGSEYDFNKKKMALNTSASQMYQRKDEEFCLGNSKFK